MKNRYITPGNFRKKSAEWMKVLQDQKERHGDLVYKPESSALLVIDMQNYFIEDNAPAFIPVGKLILSQIEELVEQYYRQDLPVVFTRYCVDRKDSEDIMNRWWGGVLLSDDPKSFLRRELDTGKGRILCKPGYSAFFMTGLEKILRKENIGQVVITGVMTHLCCETTAREAFQMGYEVYFVIDATGTYNEKIHTASLFNLAHGFAVPVTTEEILREFKE